MSDDLKIVENALIGLAEIEDELERAERSAEIARLKSVQPIFQNRSTHIQNLDRFWNIVLSQHPEFAEYIRSQDFTYLESIKDIFVSWDAANSDDTNVDPGNFSITFVFNGTDDFQEQTVVKNFWIEKIDSEEAVTKRKASKDASEDENYGNNFDETERLVSEIAHIIWPKSYDTINPSKISDKKSSEGKKNYRAGMKSFFGWFKWTGRKPGKEFPHGEELAKLFSDDIFPNAVKYYTEAQRDGLEEELDSDASEPLDLSDDEKEVRGTKRKHEED